MWLASIRGRVRARFGGRQDLDGDEPLGEPKALASSSRALVPLTPSGDAPDTPPTRARPLAPFLAQLIATKQGAPQTRARRRAGLGAAVAEYAGREAASHLERKRQHAIRSV